MFIDPSSLEIDTARLEEIEKASLRLVVQAIYAFRNEATEIFANEKDLAQDIGEDITREALDRMGVSKIDQRLFGKIDYKRARYVFHPEYALRQALFVDSKAEQEGSSATLQIGQLSLRVRHIRSGQAVDRQGTLPKVIETGHTKYLTTTIFVKYHYRKPAGADAQLIKIIVAALPNGFLQDFYNPSTNDNIWIAGRNAPTRGEEFRVRLSFSKLKNKRNWRVQTIPMDGRFIWVD